jgi:uncharacterized protein YaaN involved in tellurite resistance
MANTRTADPPTNPPGPSGSNPLPERRVVLSEETLGKLDEQAADFVNEVLALDPQDPAFRAHVDAVINLGNNDMARAASVSNRMLERPLRTLRDGVDPAHALTQGLGELRTTIEKLDPSRRPEFELPRKRLLGVIPVGPKVTSYFEEYESAQGHLNAIVQSLYRNKDELRRDNAALEAEKSTMWSLIGRLEQHVYLANQIDSALEEQLAQFDALDPDRAAAVRGDVQFYARQKIQDLHTQLAVCMQGIVAFDLLQKNNVELMKGVDRAAVTTVSALRTAVLVSEALAGQKIVLDRLSTLNEATGSLIETTSKMLAESTAQTYVQAAASTVDIGKLQAAFENVYATIDAVDAFKQAAVVNMGMTVNALALQIDKAKAFLARSKEAAGTYEIEALPDQAALAAGGEVAGEPRAAAELLHAVR